MSAVGERARGLQRPYTVGTFKRRLAEFRTLISELTLQNVQASPEEKRRLISENLRYDQFCESIRDLFGTDMRSRDLKAVYRKVTTNPDVEVDWSELFGYCEAESAPRQTMVGEEVSVFTVSARRRFGDAAGDQKRRDTVVSIRHIPMLDSFLVASQKGALSLWTSSLRLQACIDINETSWVTGCDYMPTLRRVATCTERSVCLWDIRAKGKNPHVFTIRPIEHSPQCLISVPWASDSPHEDTVLFGDDEGFVNMMTVAVSDLTVKMKNTKNERSYSQSYVIDPTKLARPIRRKKFHNSCVLKLKYFPALRCVGSCSPSSTQSFVLEEIQRVFDDVPIRHVSIPKGVNSFDFCVKANIIATGGVDKVIRVWHPHIFSRPTGKLIGHLFTIVDITCNEKDEHIISLSTARVFRIWDIQTLTILQVFTDNDERPGEKRIYSMVFDNKRDRLLTGSSVLDFWPLTRDVQDTMQVPQTHDRPIVHVLYNKELHQVVTTCLEPQVKIWEAESGSLLYRIVSPHGQGVEVTAVTIDPSGYRLVTAAFDGSVKVWDFGSGQEIKSTKQRSTDEDLSVLGLEYCTIQDNRCIVALGWRGKMKLLLDAFDFSELVVVRTFNDVHYTARDMALAPLTDRSTVLPHIGEATAQETGEFRKACLLSTHDLTSVASLPPDTIITGCSNGDLIVWDTNTCKVSRLISFPDDDVSNSMDMSWSNKHVSVEQKHNVTVVKCLIHRAIPPPKVNKRKTPTSGSRTGTVSRGRSRGVSRGTTYSKRQSRPGSAASLKIVSVVIDEDAVREPETEHMDVEQADKTAETNEIGNDNKAAEKEEKWGHDDDNLAGKDGKGTCGDDRTREGGDKRVETSETIPENETVKQEPELIAYDPIIVAGYQDGHIRFWNLQGELQGDVTSVTRRRELTAVTAICHDENCNYLITGDKRGYLTRWNIASFLKKPRSDKKEDAVQQTLCWRAHLTKVVQLAYIDSVHAIVSASTDCSVRIWWRKQGRFVGFYAQQRVLSFPTTEDTQGSPLLPYDITEGPLAPVKTTSAKQKLKAQKKFEYPLMFDNAKWKPFRRSAHKGKRLSTRQLTDMKFFEALIKPRPYNAHLESFTTGEIGEGAVFRALPVYRIQTPAHPKPPVMSRKLILTGEAACKPTSYFGHVNPRAK